MKSLFGQAEIVSHRPSGIGSHQHCDDGKDEWLTPKEIVNSLGEFDLDPCAPIKRPWPTAHKHFTTVEDGLSREWFGRVWLNPPYGSQIGKWMDRMAKHGNGIALTFARTETEIWFKSVWPAMSAILFLQGRLYFHHVSGHRARGNAGAPSALIAYGESNVLAIRNSGIAGQLVIRVE